MIERVLRPALRNKRVMRLPNGLFHHGFGWIFGSRLLLLEHTGRRSGVLHHVTLDVVHRQGFDQYVVLSGLGVSSDWWRNCVARPDVRLSIGRRRGIAARAHPLSDGERDRLLRDLGLIGRIARRVPQPSRPETTGRLVTAMRFDVAVDATGSSVTADPGAASCALDDKREREG